LFLRGGYHRGVTEAEPNRLLFSISPALSFFSLAYPEYDGEGEGTTVSINNNATGAEALSRSSGRFGLRWDFLPFGTVSRYSEGYS